MEYRRENGASFPGHPAAGLAELSSQHNNRGLFEHLAGKLDEAEREYHTALQLQPDNSAALSNYGFLLQQQGRHEESLPWFEKAIAAQPNYSMAHNNLGNSRLALGDHAGAIAAFRAALAGDPGHTAAQINLAQALHVSGDLVGAAKAYTDLLDHDPNNTEILYAAGVLHASTGNLDLSGKLLDRVLLLDIHHAEAWSARAFVSLARRDYGTAMEHARRAIELAPENPRARYNFALACLATGDLESADTHLTNAIQSQSDFLEAIHNLAIVKMAREYWAEAVELLVRVKNAGPPDENVDRNLEIALSRISRSSVSN
jgi:Flp pilus assembly protein TadD